MLTYIYTARNQAGQKVTAEVEADNESVAARLLLERGLSPIDIKVKAEKGGLGSLLGKKVPTKEKIVFSRQLSTLINAGLPLVQSLSSVRDQMKNPAFKEIITKVIQDVEAGASLANALAKHPKEFNEVYVSLIAAGEASGTLDKSLERLATQQEKDSEITSRVRGAMVYPIIVIIVLFAVLIFMMSTVLPQVQNLYASSAGGAQLPIVTRVLLDFTHLLKKFWLIGFIAVGLGGFFLNRYLHTAAGKATTDRLKLKAWPVANLFIKLYMARFARVAATLVSSGVPIIKMLATSASSVGNVQIAKAIDKASEDVKGGKALSDSLARDKVFPDLVPNMIRIGEQSGQLDAMLAKLADYYEKELDDQIKAVSTIIEPVLMIFVGIIAIVIVVAVLLPIYSLAGKNLNI